MSGSLKVQLSHAVGLKSMDSNGYSDPYFKVTVGKETQKSAKIRKTLNPRWENEVFRFKGDLRTLIATPIKVQGWDWDRLSMNDPLGDGEIDLQAHMPQLGTCVPIPCSVQLRDGQATPGEVFFVVTWEGTPVHGGIGSPYGGGGSFGAGIGGGLGAGGNWSRIQNTFNHFDTNRSGFLGYSEVRRALQHYGINATNLDAIDVLRRYDDHPDGRMEVAEFGELIRDLDANIIRSPAPPYSPARADAQFAMADANRSGFVDYNELKPVLRQFGHEPSTATARAVVRAYDSNPDGKLDRREFAELVGDLDSGRLRRDGGGFSVAHGAVPARVSAAFYHFDTNRSGFLSNAELRRALRYYGIDASHLESSSILRRYDDHPDGRLELAEFAELVRDLEDGVLRGTPSYRGRGIEPYSRARGAGAGGRFGPVRPGGGYGGGDLEMGHGGGYGYYPTAPGQGPYGEWTVRQWIWNGGVWIVDVAVRTAITALAACYLIAPDKFSQAPTLSMMGWLVMAAVVALLAFSWLCCCMQYGRAVINDRRGGRFRRDIMW